MSYRYNKKIGKTGVKIKNLYRIGAILSSFNSQRFDKKIRTLSVQFRLKGWYGIIRKTYMNTYAVDVQTEEFPFRRDRCITPECKNIQETKDVLYDWFTSHPFTSFEPITGLGKHQPTLSPFIF